jgi:hypothetical protein
MLRYVHWLLNGIDDAKYCPPFQAATEHGEWRLIENAAPNTSLARCGIYRELPLASALRRHADGSVREMTKAQCFIDGNGRWGVSWPTELEAVIEPDPLPDSMTASLVEGCTIFSTRKIGPSCSNRQAQLSPVRSSTP